MPKTFSLGPIFAVIPAAIEDYHSNLPLPQAPSASLGDIATALKRAQGSLEAIAAIVAAHPGAIRALDRVLGAIEAQKDDQGKTLAPWATGARAFITTLPSGLEAARRYLPDVITALSMFEPAATGIPGGWSGARGHV